MAKLLKITGYLVVEDDINELDVQLAAKQLLASKFDGIEQPFKVESADLGKNLFYTDDWTNHPLNSIDCTLTTCESYFNPMVCGYVIVNKTTGFYYNGMNQWKKDLRDAKIYHTEKGALETIEYKFDSNIVPVICKIQISTI